MAAQTLAEALAEGSAPLVEVDIDALLEKLPLEEQISLLSTNVNWETSPIERLGIPALKISDGSDEPKRGFHYDGTKAAGFPSYTSLASTFNPDLSNRIGQAMGEKLRTKGIHVFLGPTIHSYRSSFGGRNIERFSQDPLLSGVIAAGFVNGLQSENIGAALEYFPSEEQNTRGFSGHGTVEDGRFRERDLRPFEIVVKTSHPWCITTIPLSKQFLQTILRDEWKFDGLVIQNGGSLSSTGERINAGIELDLPWSTDSQFEKVIRKVIDDGLVTTQTITARARAVLRLLQRTGQLTSQFNAEPETTEDQPERKELIREGATEGIVLLKNARNILPLDETKLKKIALLGPMVKYSASHVSLIDAFTSRLSKDVEITYSQGVPFGPDNTKEAELKILSEALALAREADYAICFIGDTEKGNLELDNFSTEPARCELVSQVTKVNPNTIVVNTTDEAISLPFFPHVTAFMQTWYTGQETSNAILDVLLGDVSPSGKLAILWPEYLGDGADSKVLFPFGYGLSYTTFVISNPRLFGKIEPTSNEGVTISVFVENTGSVAGGETIQAYISSPEKVTTEILKDGDEQNEDSKKKLVAFAKVFLDPGEKRLVTLNFENDAVAFWDVDSGGWMVKAGNYQVLLGNSSRDEDLEVRLEMFVKEGFGFPA